MARTASPDPHRHASQRIRSRVLSSLARQIARRAVKAVCHASVRLALRFKWVSREMFCMDTDAHRHAD